MTKSLLLLSSGLSLGCLLPAHADLVLIDENFAAFATSQTYSGGLTVTWTDNDGTPTGFERYTPPSGPRATDGTYDHDDDGGAVTPQINLSGALEVNDDAPAMTLTGQFVLPAGVGPNDSFQLHFGADARGGTAFTSSVEIENITDSRFALANSNIVYGAPDNDPDWKRNDFAGFFVPADAGDTFQIRFTSTGDGGQGLQLTELYFTAIAVPEPSVAALLGLGAFILLRRSIRR